MLSHLQKKKIISMLPTTATTTKSGFKKKSNNTDNALQVKPISWWIKDLALKKVIEISE